MNIPFICNAMCVINTGSKDVPQEKNGFPASMSLVTRIAVSEGLTQAKFSKLRDMAEVCGKIRQEAWRRYGSINGVGRTARSIRDQDWLSGNCLGEKTDLPARIWKATLQDTLDDISACRSAAIKIVVANVCGRGDGEDICKQRIRMLKDGTWVGNSLLRRLMRREWKHGKTSVRNQIVLDCQCYTTFERNGRMWIKVTSLVPLKRLAIPLKYGKAIEGTIRLILRDDGEVEIHHAVVETEACVSRSCGDKEIGLDKGYSEAFTDHEGVRHGDGLGKILSEESDHLKVVWASRRKLAVLANKAEVKGNHAKAQRIRKNNLGKIKLTSRKARQRNIVRTHVFTAAHSVLDNAGSVVVEDLSKPIRGRDRGRNTNRRLSGWVKGLIQEAVEATSRRRGASLDQINAAYTSQWLPCCSTFGKRSGDVIYCTCCGAVYDADTVAAGNILDRKYDQGIGRHTPYRQVKVILEARARQAAHQRLRLRLPSQDSSCVRSDRQKPASTESKPS
jgi:IS605 OrfB family transposase